MEVKLLDLAGAQLARLLGLVRSVEPIALEESRDWGLLIRGRGFTRLLEQGVLDAAPCLHRPASSTLPRPMTFRGKRAAIAYAQSVRLTRTQRAWKVRAG